MSQLTNQSQRKLCPNCLEAGKIEENTALCEKFDEEVNFERLIDCVGYNPKAKPKRKHESPDPEGWGESHPFEQKLNQIFGGKKINEVTEILRREPWLSKTYGGYNYIFKFGDFTITVYPHRQFKNQVYRADIQHQRSWVSYNSKEKQDELISELLRENPFLHELTVESD